MEVESVTIQRITTNIQQLNQNVQTLDNYVDLIGGTGDDETMRSLMNELVRNSNALSKNTNSMIKELVMSESDDRRFRVRRERLMSDYMAVLNRLQTAQRKAVVKEKAQIKSVAYEDQALSSSNGESDSIQLKQIQQQHRINLNEIRERQHALSELENDIGDVNQIFKDLAHIVHDQGEMVDSIEANIEHSSIHVSQAHTNITQAHHYQTKARQKKILLSGFCIALLLIIILIIYLWSR